MLRRYFIDVDKMVEGGVLLYKYSSYLKFKSVDSFFERWQSFKNWFENLIAYLTNNLLWKYFNGRDSYN